MTSEDVLKKFVPYSERIMITGCHGLLGQKLHHLLNSTNEIIGVNVAKVSHLTGPHYQYLSLDITKASEVIDAIVETRPRFIVNTAAMTGVDLCETEKNKCWRTNVLAVENLARGARKANSHLIQLSSDYIFNGKEAPYKEEDLPNPLGFYGKSKLASENALRGIDISYAIVRTQVLYGVAPGIRPNFVDFVRERLAAGETLSIVDGQVGNPTLADDLAEGIARIMQLRKTGIFHISGSESISRYHFARKIAVELGEDPTRIKPLDPAKLKQDAERPDDSTFCLDKLNRQLAYYPRNVAEGLREYHRQLRELQAALGG